MTPEPMEVFVSYSHADEAMKDALLKHLKLLQRRHIISAWHDRKIGAGHEVAAEIDEHLETARVIVLLVSADFLASDYCYDIEMKRALERHEADEARVIPVILRPVDWRLAPFAKLKTLPRDGKPVVSWPNLDEAFADVAEGIRLEVDSLRSAVFDVLMEKARSAASARNWPNVVNLVERVMETWPDYQGARQLLARALVARWRRKLRASFLQSIEMPYGGQDTQDKLVADLHRALTLDPENPEYLYMRGCLDRSDNRRQKADLTRAIELNPSEPKYYYARGRLASFHEDKESADSDFRRVMDLGFRVEATSFTFEFTPSWLPAARAKPERTREPEFEIDVARMGKHIEKGLDDLYQG